jgi:hypothetical protein
VRLQTLWGSRFNARLRAYAEAMGDRPLSARDFWPRHDGMPVGDGWAHRVAATLWPDRYMEMLATFPAPFQHGFGTPLSPLDQSLATALVRASPSVFSSNGEPLGPVVVFVLLEMVETQLAAIAVQDLTSAQAGVAFVLRDAWSRGGCRRLGPKARRHAIVMCEFWGHTSALRRASADGGAREEEQTHEAGFA